MHPFPFRALDVSKNGLTVFFFKLINRLQLYHYSNRKRSVLNFKIIASHRYTIEEDGTLVIKKLNIEDSGMFQCEAENEGGSDSISTWLKVKSKCAQHDAFVRRVLFYDVCLERNRSQWPTGRRQLYNSMFVFNNTNTIFAYD